jgi:epoxyqueuosine reductase
VTRAAPARAPRLDGLRAAASALGFDLASVASVEPLSRDGAALAAWLDGGFAGGMAYMERARDLAWRPRALVPEALSLVTLAVNHHAAAPPFRAEGRYGRVARYAWGRDYHDVVRPRLRALVARIEEAEGRPVRARVFVDAVPLLERAAAARAGLGFAGKNTCLIAPRAGSWMFLAEVLLDVAYPTGGAPVAVGCGSCTRCLVACPTGAFAGPHRLDARRCVSYLTIEHRGPIPRDLREGCGAWVFGCDACQDVCPFNRFATETAWEDLRPEAGVGPRLDLAEVLSLATDEAFRARFAGTALLRPRRRGLLRNAAVAAANVRCEAAVPALRERAERDPEPLVRGHALWALSVLDAARAAALADRVRRTDPDPSVREEAEAALAVRRSPSAASEA